MPTSTVENYVKEIYLAQQNRGKGPVPMGQVARALGVVPGTATTMVKSLADSGLVRYEPRRGVRLTEDGSRLALRMLRRHRLVELFLVRTLHLDWSEIHEEADRLEHAISDHVLDKLDAFLGYPKLDPHGDPIPNAEGKIDDRKLQSLADCDLKRPLRIARITDQDAEFLTFIDQNNLRPGTQVSVSARSQAADAVTLNLTASEATFTLGLKAARKILVD